MDKDENKKLNFNIKLTLNDARKLLVYFDDEFMDIYEEFLETLEIDHNDNNEELEYYDELRDILETFTYELHKEVRKKERAISRDFSDDIDDTENILKKLNIYSATILKKIKEADKKNNDYPIFKLYWYLHTSFDKTGELIFTQSSLEDLLELDRNRIIKFLDMMSKIEIKIGNKKGKIIEKYKVLNSSTIKISYNMYVIKPHLAQLKDKNFKLGSIENITAKFL